MNREDVIAFLKDRRPMNFREMTSAMGISRPEARTLKRILRELVREGEILRTRNGLYGPRTEMSLMKGYFEAHRNGYGFVVLDTPGEKDLFIPPHARGGAMEADRVIVRVENWRRREGRIIRVLERGLKRVAGKIEQDRTGYYLKPKRKSVPFDIYIPPGKLGGAKRGDGAIIEITDWPTENRPPAGKVVKKIEAPGEPGAEIEAVVEELGLPRRFPTAVKTEAKAMQSRTIPMASRKDLRDLATVTIDGENAKDFDDAISIERLKHGYRLWVHIADVAHYVGWDSETDLEARQRGTSFYFPDRVIPMLPKELSEDLASLRPQRDRPTVTVEMDFKRNGESDGYRIYNSVINSNERMTYTSVKKILVDHDPVETERYASLVADFELMAELASLLRQRRMGRGSLDFDLPEPEVLLDMQGRPEAIIRAERNLAHMLIEDFMIAANEAVAEHLTELGVPSIYRVHEKPDPIKISDMLYSIHSAFGTKATDIHSLLDAFRGRPQEDTVSFIVLRTLKQARYSTINVGHFGLASTCYTHFTSPIRRYPDLVTHRIVKEVIKHGGISGKRAEELENQLPDIAFVSSKAERLADEAERDVLNALRAWFMKDRIGEEFEAVVVGVTTYGLRIRLKDVYVEGLIPLSLMIDDYYVYDEKGMTLKGRRNKRKFILGQTITARIDRVDTEEREIIFGI